MFKSKVAASVAILLHSLCHMAEGISYLEEILGVAGSIGVKLELECP